MGMMDLLNSFRQGTTAQPANPATPQNPQSQGPKPPMAGGNPNPQQTQVDGNTAANGVVPEGSKTETPFAGFEKLWENEPPADGKPATKSKGVFGEVNPEAFAEAAKGVNFSQFVTPEIMQRMNAGGEDGVKASLEAMNSMSQALYANSAQVSTKLIEKGVDNFQKQLMQKLPDMIKKHNTSNTLRQENPIFANPAAAPVLEMIQSRLQQKFPKASEAELATMAKKYISDLATPTSTADEEETSKAKKGDDWESYFGLE